MNVLSLFDGMSCGQIALNRIGITPDKYYASEIDEYAATIAKKNYPGTIHLGDIKNWRLWDIDWASIDLLIGGSPCQGFSLLGGQLALDDPRSALFLTFVDILNHVKTANPCVRFLLENVKMKPECTNMISRLTGVLPRLINSNLVVPQGRGRNYWANWKLRGSVSYSTTLDDIIQFIDDGKAWRPATVRKGAPRQVVFTGDVLGCLTASYCKGIDSDGRPALATREGSLAELRESNDVRQLTPVECERLQTVPDNYPEGVSKTQRYKMLGNGWTVDVIAHIFRAGLL